MKSYYQVFKRSVALRRILLSFTIIAFSCNIILPSAAFAQAVPGMDSRLVQPGAVIAPALIKGLIIYPDKPLTFDFIVDTGERTGLDKKEQSADISRMVKYFMASITIPEKDQWVNLSPVEPDRIIPKTLALSDLGRDMLDQDYFLKRITASLTFPEKDLGRKFWDNVYKRAREEYGITDVPLNMFNRVWILPRSAKVLVDHDRAFIVESSLKVMLEDDYAQTGGSLAGADKSVPNELQAVQLKAMREIIIPELEKEVNQGEHFTRLRQIYHSLILGKWYRERIKDRLMSRLYIDKSKISGIDLADKNVKEKIYGDYVASFKTGIYDYIKEESDPLTQEIVPRHYVAGGITDLAQGPTNYVEFSAVTDRDLGDMAGIPQERGQVVTVELNPRDKAQGRNKISNTLAALTLVGTLAASAPVAGAIGVGDGSGAVKVAWDTVTGAEGYEVLLRRQGETYTQGYDVGPVSTATLSGLNLAGQQYYIVVRAYNSVTKSGFSNEVATTVVPLNVTGAPNELILAGKQDARAYLDDPNSTMVLPSWMANSYRIIFNGSDKNNTNANFASVYLADPGYINIAYDNNYGNVAMPSWMIAMGFQQTAQEIMVTINGQQRPFIIYKAFFGAGTIVLPGNQHGDGKGPNMYQVFWSPTDVPELPSNLDTKAMLFTGDNYVNANVYTASPLVNFEIALGKLVINSFNFTGSGITPIASNLVGNKGYAIYARYDVTTQTMWWVLKIGNGSKVSEFVSPARSVNAFIAEYSSPLTMNVFLQGGIKAGIIINGLEVVTSTPENPAPTSMSVSTATTDKLGRVESNILAGASLGGAGYYAGFWTAAQRAAFFSDGIMPSGAAARYEFASGEGMGVPDMTGNGRIAVMTNGTLPNWINPWNGGGMSAELAGSYFVPGQGILAAPTPAFTIDGTLTIDPIADKTTNFSVPIFSNSTGDYSLSWVYNAATKKGAWTFVVNGKSAISTMALTAAQFNSMYAGKLQVTAVFVGGSKMVAYINGVAVATLASGVPVQYTPALGSELRVGISQTGDKLSGRIIGFKVYPGYAFTDENIRWTQNGYPWTRGIGAAYTFDDGNSFQIDQSFNNNSGGFISDPLWVGPSLPGWNLALNGGVLSLGNPLLSTQTNATFVLGEVAIPQLDPVSTPILANQTSGVGAAVSIETPGDGTARWKFTAFGFSATAQGNKLFTVLGPALPIAVFNRIYVGDNDYGDKKLFTIVPVVNGTGKTLSLYVGGELIATGSGPSNLVSGTTPYWVGGDAQGRALIGSVERVHTHTVALPLASIISTSAGIPPAVATTLAQDLRLNPSNINGTTVVDLSGKNKPGTLSGSVYPQFTMRTPKNAETIALRNTVDAYFQAMQKVQEAMKRPGANPDLSKLRAQLVWGYVRAAKELIIAEKTAPTDAPKEKADAAAATGGLDFRQMLVEAVNGSSSVQDFSEKVLLNVSADELEGFSPVVVNIRSVVNVPALLKGKPLSEQSTPATPLTPGSMPGLDIGPVLLKLGGK